MSLLFRREKDTVFVPFSFAALQSDRQRALHLFFSALHFSPPTNFHISLQFKTTSFLQCLTQPVQIPLETSLFLSKIKETSTPPDRNSRRTPSFCGMKYSAPTTLSLPFEICCKVRTSVALRQRRCISSFQPDWSSFGYPGYSAPTQSLVLDGCGWTRRRMGNLRMLPKVLFARRWKGGTRPRQLRYAVLVDTGGESR